MPECKKVTSLLWIVHTVVDRKVPFDGVDGITTPSILRYLCPCTTQAAY
jgi:hypothetical protein